MHGSKFSRHGSPTVPVSGKSRSAGAAAGVGGFSRPVSARKSLSRGAILADIFMVVVWGATIPGLMWLGAAGGF